MPENCWRTTAFAPPTSVWPNFLPRAPVFVRRHTGKSCTTGDARGVMSVLARDDHRRTVPEQALVGGDADPGALDLATGGLALQLPGQLADLRDGLGRDGLAEAGQPARR